MSVVAIKNYKDKIVIGADSFIGIGWGMQKKDKTAKLGKVNKDIIIGTVGYAKDHFLLKTYANSVQIKSSTEDGIIEYMTQYHKWVKDKTTDVNFDLSNSIHTLIFKDKAYIFNDYYVDEIKEGQYEATGAGKYFAKTALFLGQSVKKAIEVSCELSPYCEAPINIIEIEK